MRLLSSVLVPQRENIYLYGDMSIPGDASECVVVDGAGEAYVGWRP
jgi:hypothetical protein